MTSNKVNMILKIISRFPLIKLLLLLHNNNQHLYLLKLLNNFLISLNQSASEILEGCENKIININPYNSISPD